MGSPINKDEVLNVTKAVLGTFTTQYTKHYALALAAKKEREATEEPRPWKLLERPESEASTDDLKCGYLTKQGGLRKSWKKRWFVVRHDYTIDYFADEKAAKKAKPKPKGTISLAGYTVNDDVGKSLLGKLQDLAEKMGMDVNDLPKPKEYPELTIEFSHSRRRTYYIQAGSKEEKEEWVEMFKTCARRAWGFKDREECHTKGFENAIRETRWELGRWGWWSYGGTEEQVLSDLVSDELDYQIMGGVYAKLPSGPWMIRNAARNQVLKVIDTVVGSAVTPAWKTMSAAVKEIRPKIEPTIAELVVPLATAKTDIMGKIKDACMSLIEPILAEHVTPHLSKILEIVSSPFTGGLTAQAGHIDKQLSEYASKTTDLAKMEEGFRDLNYFGRSYWSSWDALKMLDVLYEPLYLLREIFPDIWPWGTIQKGRDFIMQVTDNSVYTFQVKLKAFKEKGGEAAEVIEKAKNSTLKKLKKDCDRMVRFFFVDVIKAIVLPPFTKNVIPACKSAIEPLQSAIPDAMKQFIDIMEMFNKLLNDLIEDATGALFK